MPCKTHSVLYIDCLNLLVLGLENLSLHFYGDFLKPPDTKKETRWSVQWSEPKIIKGAHFGRIDNIVHI